MAEVTATTQGSSRLQSNAPTGDITTSWDRHKFDLKLVNPANKRKFNIIVVGTGLAGASAAASLAELGYNVKAFCFQDSPRRAHSIAAQGGINAAKNYCNVRHGQRGRLPRSRVERLSVGVGQHEHHRPMRGAGRSVPARLRRAVGQSLVRWCSGFANVLRSRADWTAVVARRVFRADAAGRSRQSEVVRSPRDAGSHQRGRCCSRDRRAEPRHGRV
ncbi:MAG: succinate dehydrogenase flavoprotein subunit [Planctomycetota bacterium]|nr:MAG: succinate dehydrogenase flavoprotein subunit [Planctomycetota bacterium]